MREKQKKSIQSHRSLVPLFQTARDICERFERKTMKVKSSPEFLEFCTPVSKVHLDPRRISSVKKLEKILLKRLITRRLHFLLVLQGNLVCLHHQNVKETRKEEEKRVCFLGRTKNKETPSSEWNVLMVRRI